MKTDRIPFTIEAWNSGKYRCENGIGLEVIQIEDNISFLNNKTYPLTAYIPEADMRYDYTVEGKYNALSDYAQANSGKEFDLFLIPIESSEPIQTESKTYTRDEVGRLLAMYGLRIDKVMSKPNRVDAEEFIDSNIEYVRGMIEAEKEMDNL